MVSLASMSDVAQADNIIGGVVLTQTGMGSAQAINAAWLTAKMTDQKRPVALAAYVMSIQLANFPGNQLFETKGICNIHFGDSKSRKTDSRPDAPRYSRGLKTAAACAIAAAGVILIWKLLYRVFDHGDRGIKVEYGVDPVLSTREHDSV